VKVLLDENFPLPLLEALRREGIEAETSSRSASVVFPIAESASGWIRRPCSS
jgi:hypothetical protein